MGKNKKVKKVVGAANDIARGVRARQAEEIDALPAAGGGELSAADAEGSAVESMVPGGTGPPARSVLEDEGPRPDDEASGQAGVAVGANGARPTVEQEGAEVRRIATEIAVANKPRPRSASSAPRWRRRVQRNAARWDTATRSTVDGRDTEWAMGCLTPGTPAPRARISSRGSDASRSGRRWRRNIGRTSWCRSGWRRRR